MEERYLWKVVCKLGTWIDVRMDQEFFVSSKQGSEDEARRLAEQIIGEKWGDEWDILEFEVFEYIGRVYIEERLTRNENYSKSRTY